MQCDATLITFMHLADTSIRQRANIRQLLGRKPEKKYNLLVYF